MSIHSFICILYLYLLHHHLMSHRYGHNHLIWPIKCLQYSYSTVRVFVRVLNYLNNRHHLLLLWHNEHTHARTISNWISRVVCIEDEPTHEKKSRVLESESEMESNVNETAPYYRHYCLRPINYYEPNCIKERVHCHLSVWFNAEK